MGVRNTSVNVSNMAHVYPLCCSFSSAFKRETEKEAASSTDFYSLLHFHGKYEAYRYRKIAKKCRKRFFLFEDYEKGLHSSYLNPFYPKTCGFLGTESVWSGYLYYQPLLLFFCYEK